MLAKINSFGLLGIKGYPIEIEVDINTGLSSYDIVGLADTAIKESKERVRSAIRNSGFQFPIDKIVINMAPADTKKEGSLYDLPIAVGILVSSEIFPKESSEKFAYVGELSFDGSVKKVNGILPLLISALQNGITKVIVPYDNQMEASFIEKMEVYPVKNLKELLGFLSGEITIDKVEPRSFDSVQKLNRCNNDFKDVKGQALAKRALEIAAAGGHNIIMVGTPGSGKSMLAKAFPSILPDLSFEEALEVTKIHSVAGILDNNVGIIANRPFRSPHHTATTIALVGGGSKARPGEVSLAHSGVLFLDELPEYSRQSIETLRQPLEDGYITVARNALTVEYPSKIMLVASMNPCPCGYYGSNTNICSCTPTQIHNYLKKLSGPLLDRIDLHVEVDSISYADINDKREGECSEIIKERVNNARKIQIDRYLGTNIHCNAQMTNQQVKKYCVLDDECENILSLAFDKLKLTARAYTRILKVARTIADLDNKSKILPEHIAEAISYRSLDKKFKG